VRRSTDSGTTWERFNIPGMNGNCYTIVAHEGDLYVGCNYAPVYKRPVDEVLVGVGPGSSIPRAYELLPNYPNPFNPTTVVSYQLPATSDVRLSVYDLLGREVAVLVNGKEAPGKYEVTFDARNLASGMYLYRLTAGSFGETKKMFLVK
jgi:hypothetical protein